MASDLIGRTACPECGFHAAHVKIKTDKEGAQPYRHCPECGAQYFPRNKQQAANLRAQIRPDTQTQTPPAEPDTPPSGTSAEPANLSPAPVRKSKGFFAQLAEGIDD